MNESKEKPNRCKHCDCCVLIDFRLDDNTILYTCRACGHSFIYNMKELKK